MSPFDPVDADATPELAERLRVSPSYFRDTFGGPWRPAGGSQLHDYDADPSGGVGFPVTPWHVNGDPEQLLIRVFDGHCFVARAVGRWLDLGRLGWDPADEVHLDQERVHRPEEVREVLSGLVRRRRRQLRWCRDCRSLQAPERMVDDTCHACAAARGVVF